MNLEFASQLAQDWRQAHRHQSQTTIESMRPEPTPKLSAIPASGLQFRIELGLIRLRSHPEYIATSTLDHP